MWVKLFVNIKYSYRNKIPELFVYLKDLINKEVLTIGIRAYGFNRFKGGRRFVVFVRSLKKTEVRSLLLLFEKETEENNILNCGTEHSEISFFNFELFI